MKHPVRLVLLICCLAPAIGRAGERAVQPSASAITGTGAGRKATLVVIDVRTPEEYRAGHADGTTNLPINELTRRIGTVVRDKGAPLAVHCQSGGRSARAKRILEEEGYTNVTDLGSLAHAREVLEAKSRAP